MDLEQFDFTDGSSVSPINVLVCDNESLFREILVAALHKEPLINVVGAVASGTEAIELVKVTTPDVVLMDIELGDGPNGIVIAAEIKNASPETGIVILSAHRDKEFLAGFLDEGTIGWSFLLKQSVADIHFPGTGYRIGSRRPGHDGPGSDERPVPTSDIASRTTDAQSDGSVDVHSFRVRRFGDRSRTAN